MNKQTLPRSRRPLLPELVGTILFAAFGAAYLFLGILLILGTIGMFSAILP